MSSHAREEACARSDVPTDASEVKGPKGGSSGHKVRNKDCVWPRNVKHVVAGNVVIEELGVSCDSEVVSVRPSPQSSVSLACVILLTRVVRFVAAICVPN